jgi:hypothetical protein
VSATPKHRRDTVERAPTEAASRNSRVRTVSSSDTPIYEALIAEWTDPWATEWPVVKPEPAPDPDPPTERFATLRFPDDWFAPLPTVEHNEPPTGSLFQHALVGGR